MRQNSGNIWFLKTHTLLGTPNQVHSRSPKEKIFDSWKTTIFWGPQTKFIHGALKEKYLIPEIMKKQHAMKHSKYMNWCYCAAGRMELAGEARAILKSRCGWGNCAFCKTTFKESLHRVAAQTMIKTNVAVAGGIVRPVMVAFCQLRKRRSPLTTFKHNLARTHYSCSQGHFIFSVDFQ